MCDPLLRHQCVGILVLTGDAVPLGDDLGGLPHAEVDARPPLGERLVVEIDAAEVLVLHHGDRFDTGADDGVDLADHHAVGGHGDGIETRRAETIDGRARHRRGKPGAQRSDAPDILPGGPLGEPAAHQDAFDLVIGELGNVVQCGADGVGGEIVRPGQVEGAAIALGETGSLAGDDDGFLHDVAPRLGDDHQPTGDLVRRRIRLA